METITTLLKWWAIGLAPAFFVTALYIIIAGKYDPAMRVGRDDLIKTVAMVGLLWPVAATYFGITLLVIGAVWLAIRLGGGK